MKSSLRTSVSLIALFGSLGLLPAGEASATAIFPPVPVGPCPGQTPYAAGRTSAVLSAVEGSGPYDYGFSICNTSGWAPASEELPNFFLRDWELPYDPAGGISNLTAPSGWAVTIETIGNDNPTTGWDGEDPTWFDPNDPFYDARYLGLTQVIHFFTCTGTGESESSCYGEFGAGGSALDPGEGLSGFGFTSPFGPTNSPYQASWLDLLPPRSGDPAFPTPPAGGPNTPGLLSLPEPGGLALFGAALAAFLAARRRKEPGSGG